MTARSVPEWIGATPDSAIPARVRLRVFEAHGGRCWLTGRKIMAGEAWDMDHKVALINGGEHRESNLAPALRDTRWRGAKPGIPTPTNATAIGSEPSSPP